MKNLTSLLIFAIFISIGNSQDYEDPLESFGKWMEQGDKVVREKRDLEQIVKMVAGVTQGFQNLPGLSGFSNMNLEELLGTLASMTQQLLDSLSCCQAVGVPGTFMAHIETCVRESIMQLASELSEARNKTNMVTPIVNSGQIMRAVNGGMCTMKCAFTKAGLSTDGLPSGNTIINMLAQNVKPEAIDVITPAIRTCDKILAAARNEKAAPLSEDDKCWAANSYMDCLRVEVYENCPPERKQQGADCPIKLGNKFWQELPTKSRVLVDSIKQMFP